MFKATVVIPTLNEAQNIGRCLEALEKQSFRDFKVIVVDGGSVDKTVEIARSFGVKVLELKTPNVARQRQIGFDAADSEIIVSLDADTFVFLHWLERLLAPFSDPQVVEVIGGLAYEGANFIPSLVETVCERFLLGIGIPPATAANIAVRKTAFQMVKGFRLPNGEFPRGYPELEAVWLGLKLRRIGKIVFLPHIKVITSPRRLRNPAMVYWWSISYLWKMGHFMWWIFTHKNMEIQGSRKEWNY